MIEFKNITTKRLKEVASIFSGFAFKAEDLKATGIPVLKIGNIQGKKVTQNIISFFPNEKFDKKLYRFVYQKEDILVAMTGEGSVGKFGKMEAVDKAYLVNQRVGIIRPFKDVIDPLFLYYVVTLSEYEEALYQLGLGAGQPNVSPKDIGNLFIPYPSLSTQKRISTILNAYDELIDVNNQRIKLLEETASQFYKEWFVRMRFHGYKKAKFEKGLPTNAGAVKYFKDFIKLNRGFDLPETKIIEGPYPVIASTSIKAYHNQFKIKAPIITTGRSGSLGTVLYTNQDGWALNTSLYVKDFMGNQPLFVYYFLKSMDLESFNAGAGVPTLNQNHLHKLKLWVPNNQLQKRFAEITQTMFNQIDNLNKQNEQLRQIRDRLLPRLISGKLEVKNLEEEADSEEILNVAAEPEPLYN